MDIYHIWFNLKPGVRDLEFVADAEHYLEHLGQHGELAAWRITRCKLGFGAPGLGEFHIMLEFDGLARLEDAFRHVATRADPVESLHHAVNSKVRDFTAALYRDFPDPVRKRGEEKF